MLHLWCFLYSGHRPNLRQLNLILTQCLSHPQRLWNLHQLFLTWTPDHMGCRPSSYLHRSPQVWPLWPHTHPRISLLPNLRPRRDLELWDVVYQTSAIFPYLQVSEKMKWNGCSNITNKPLLCVRKFWCPWETSLLKTLWEKEKLRVTSNFSFSHSVFYLFG